MNALKNLLRFLLISKPTERCVMCWKDTGIPVDCHIRDPRRKGNYQEGMGQLCEACAARTAHKF